MITSRSASFTAMALAASLSLAALPSFAAGKAAPKAKPAPATLVLKVDATKKTPKDIKKLQKEVKKVKGVVAAKLNKKKGELTVKHNPTATADAIKAAVTKAGFTLAAEEAPAAPEPAPEPTDDEGEE